MRELSSKLVSVCSIPGMERNFDTALSNSSRFEAVISAAKSHLPLVVYKALTSVICTMDLMVTSSLLAVLLMVIQPFTLCLKASVFSFTV